MPQPWFFVNLTYFKLWFLLNNLSLKNQNLTPWCCKGLGIKPFRLVARTDSLIVDFLILEKNVQQIFLIIVFVSIKLWNYFLFNPISAGVLENQETRGGGVNLTPPLNPMFDVQIWPMIHYWKALVLYF